MRAVVLLAIGALALVGCGSGHHAPQRPPARATTTPTATTPPAPNSPLPRAAAPFAARLQASHAALRTAIARWTDRTSAEPPPDVTLYALDEQRALRALAAKPRLARAALPLLPAATRGYVQQVLAAMGDLRRLSSRPHHRRFATGPALPADTLLADYAAAQRRFHVGWHVLAAVNFVESAFGRMRSDSPAGARGPMQFLPATWRAFGLGGDIRDPHDAILGAANYLSASGAPHSYAAALFHYNPSPLYVDAVRRYARLMAASRPAFYGFYAWQVFVPTPDGVRRLTGPR